MKTAILAALFAATAAAQTPIPVAKVAEDARVVDRVAQMAKRDLPADLLKRIVNEDIDLLRGKRADLTYQFASFDRQEADRKTDSFSIQPSDSNDKLTTVETRGEFMYRVILDLPTRRMIVTHNKRLWIDRVDVEYLAIGGTISKMHSVRVEEWLEPGATKSIELPEIARQATVRVLARADKATGYGNIDVTLLKAKVFDNADSPYADAVASAKAILRALDNGDIPSIRSMANRMNADLQTRLAAPPATAVASTTPAAPLSTSVDVTSPRTDVAGSTEMYAQLQSIEDLLTGTDAEKREGLDKLHQLVRKLRPVR